MNGQIRSIIPVTVIVVLSETNRTGTEIEEWTTFQRCHWEIIASSSSALRSWVNQVPWVLINRDPMIHRPVKEVVLLAGSRADSSQSMWWMSSRGKCGKLERSDLRIGKGWPVNQSQLTTVFKNQPAYRSGVIGCNCPPIGCALN